MSLPRKGIRSIHVDGADYEWFIRKKPSYSEGAFGSSMTVAVQTSGVRQHRVLLVNTGVSRPDNWISPHKLAVTPAIVSEMIRDARRSGWEPELPGPPFVHSFPLVDLLHIVETRDDQDNDD